MGKNTQVHNPLKPGMYKNDPLTKELGSKPSKREAEIADLVVQGLMNKEIALQLGIATKTVEHHMTHLFERSGMGRRVTFALWWVKQ